MERRRKLVENLKCDKKIPTALALHLRHKIRLAALESRSLQVLLHLDRQKRVFYGCQRRMRKNDVIDEYLTMQWSWKQVRIEWPT